MADDKIGKKEIQTLIDSLGDIPPKAKPLIEEAMGKMMNEGISLHDALGFTPEILEVIYQHGYHLFQSGKYEEALLVFNLLQQLNPADIRFLFAIGASHHYSKHYLEAAANYMLYTIRDNQNPIPYFHLYDCFTKAGYPSIAQNALREALRLAKLNPKYEQLKEKIQLELNYVDSLKQESKEHK